MWYRVFPSLLVSISLVIALNLPASAQGQEVRRFRASTGVVTVAPGLVLRITVSPEAFQPEFSAQFVWRKYMPSGCNNDGVCLHTIQSQGTTAGVSIGPNQAVSFDVQGTGDGVQVEVRADSRRMATNALIINSATGEIVSFVSMQYFGY